MTAERRRHPRVHADLPLRLTFKDHTVETRILDLSTSGIRFATPDSLPVMSRVQIALELPGRAGGGAADPLAITGVVVRCDRTPAGGSQFDTAIYFEQLSGTARTRLEHFVSSRRTPRPP
jgi:hypothetical protein